MNGVRRLLGAAAQPQMPAQQHDHPQQIAFAPKSSPTWPPQSPPLTDSSIPKRQRSLRETSASSSPPTTPSRLIARKSVAKAEATYKRNSGFLATRDELLISLLASEALVDSRDFDILSSEQVDDLKKEHQLLTSRLAAQTKKLSLETKIRDAAISLAKVNAQHKTFSKSTDDQLDAATRRVDTAQKDLTILSQRAAEVQTKLLEHRAAVLSHSVRSMERKIAGTSISSDDSGYASSNRSTLMSSVSLTSFPQSPSAAKPRFDGAHLFAGHADAVIPRAHLSPEAANTEIVALETKLKAATESLAQAGKKQADLARELSHMRLEKQEVETMMGMELQGAEERINLLETDLRSIEGVEVERKTWDEQRATMEAQIEALNRKVLELEVGRGEKDGEVIEELRESTKRQVEALETKLAENDREMTTMRNQWATERASWEAERADAEDEKMEDLARLQDEMERLREEDQQVVEDAQRELEERVQDLNAAHREIDGLQRELDDHTRQLENVQHTLTESELQLDNAQQELESAREALRALAQEHSVALFARDGSVPDLLRAVGGHISEVKSRLKTKEAEWDATRRKLEDELRKRGDRESVMTRDLETSRKERDEAKRTTIGLETQLKSMASPPPPKSSELPTTLPTDVSAALLPLWSILPSPEARAAKFSSPSQRTFRAGVPTTPKSPRTGSPTSLGSPTPTVSSLSELDVRSLKSLYDATRSSTGPGTSTGAGTPTTTSTPLFTLEAFAARVHALIADDRALIERLLRFAQAHELLKKNAERAQKLAYDGNVALETYQKQVRTLEDLNMGLVGKVNILQEEVQQLQDTVDRLSVEKQEVETLAAEQAETCQQLAAANNTLSARTLTLAEEAASAPTMVKRQMDDMKRTLEARVKELEDARRTLEARVKELERCETELSALGKEKAVLDARLAVCEKALGAAQDEVDAMRTSEQTQRIALLDELNSMQTENGSLRAQLRVLKK